MNKVLKRNEFGCYECLGNGFELGFSQVEETSI